MTQVYAMTTTTNVTGFVIVGAHKILSYFLLKNRNHFCHLSRDDNLSYIHIVFSGYEFFRIQDRQETSQKSFVCDGHS